MGNVPVISQVYKTTDCYDEAGYIDTPVLINQLRSADGFTRMQARHSLICIGKSAVPRLIEALGRDDTQFRWQVIKVLEGIQDPTAVPALVECLKDHNAGIRWTAASALVAYKRAAIPPLLEVLLRDSDSTWLRQGAHHILHVLKDSGMLNQQEVSVFDALEDLEPAIAVPWAAEKALEVYHRKKNSLL